MRICDGHDKLLNPKRRRFPHATAPCLAVACASASRIDRQPPLAVPSRRCRAVALRTPPGAAAAQTPRSTHPEEEASPCICLPTATISSSVCDATPPLIGLPLCTAKNPRCADSRCTDSTMAQCQPLHSLRVLSVEVNATPPPHTYRPVLGALRCVEKCSPTSGGARLLRLTTPSSLRSFDPAPPCRAASSSPHIAVIQPLALINPRRGRAVACKCIKIHPADFDTHASH